MRTTRRLLVAGLLVLAPLSLSAHDHGTAHAPAPAATGSAQDCWLPAFKAADADAVAACYTDDAVMIFPGGPLVQGRQAIRDGYAGYFAEYTVKDVRMTELGRDAHGDSVTSWGRFAITLVSRADGSESVENGRYTDLSKRVAGQWRYVVDHASDDPPPPAVPAAAPAG